MHAPKFWDKKKSVLGTILSPLGKLYAFFVAHRFKTVKPYQASIPVICVGNLSVGGTGKTPVALALGDFLWQQGCDFFFLNHGYKAKKTGVLVDPRVHTALDVGDEALLLAEKAPTITDPHRDRGAQIAENHGAKALIMDDGFQNPSLIKTVSFIVVDGKKGFGNERVLPAGPLREPVLTGLSRADAVIIVGEDTWGVEFYLKRHQQDISLLTGHFIPEKESLIALQKKAVLAFAGIGDPDKFYDMLSENGVIIQQRCSYPDHYHYTRFDIEELMRKADGLPLVTTTKDWVKIPREFRKNIFVVFGKFVFDDISALSDVLKGITECPN